MSLLANSNAISAGGYPIQRSLRFRSSASAYLTRTPASAGNRKTYTYSVWFKRGILGTAQTLLVGGRNGTTNTTFASLYYRVTDNAIDFGGYTSNFITTNGYAVFRDPSAWYHVVLAVDTTQATSANRIKLYINNVLQTVGTGAGYPAQNADTGINTADVHNIGGNDPAGGYADGYLAEVNFIDGQALTPSSFGQTDPVTGVWVPAKYTGTYGTNGFYLPFSDNTSATTLAYDKSGNGNNWTPNNISTTAGATYDSMTDVPTLTSATAANYCVWNPLITTSNRTFQNGNLDATISTVSNNSIFGTMPVSSGKWYAEFVITSAGGSYPAVGVCAVSDISSVSGNYVGSSSKSYSYYSGGGKQSNASSSTTGYTSYTTGDVIGVALDLDNGKIWFAKNNTWQESGNPSTGTTPAYTGLSGDTVFAANGYSGAVWVANFGQRPFSYTPPTGYVALNTYNLPTPTILAGNKYMDATTYTGTGAAQSITNAGGFQPDLVWMKSRSNATSHVLEDSVRGVGKNLFSNTTGAEVSESAGYSLTSFNSNGFSLGLDNAGAGSVNFNGYTYVGWQWQAGKGTTSSNTSGDITSTVSVNPTVGFSVVTWTSDGTAAVKTVGHGLGVTPKFFICKNRSGTSYWFTYHQNLTSNNYYLHLESTDAQYNTGAAFFSQSSTTIGVRQSSLATNGQTCVAYCWSEIAGFSKFGSYTGNGSTDGPFVYCGFRPKFLLIKDTTNVNSWEIIDTSRDPYNVSGNYLFTNTPAAEGSAPILDITSNGFKNRYNGGVANTSNATVIYAAFAENPFKYANAR